MLELRYSLTIEATEDAEYFSFFSDELQGFSGSGTSVEDCLARAKSGMLEHVELLAERGLPAPSANPGPRLALPNRATIETDEL